MRDSLRNTSFRVNEGAAENTVIEMEIPEGLRGVALDRDIDPMPFVPKDEADRSERCEEIFRIQSHGLAQRMVHTRSEKAVVGISGGLDSTLALLVTARTFDFLHLDRLLSIILGGILAGIGIAMCFKQGGSTGGTDIVAMIINKYRTISYGRIVITCDFTIITSALLVGYHIDTVIYGFVMTAVFGYTVDMLMAGNQQSSQVLIVTHDFQKMADTIVNNAHRGVTVLDSTGWYSKEASKVVMVVCRKRETSSILKLVKSVDPDAFITVGSVMGVYGKGFEALNKI